MVGWFMCLGLLLKFLKIIFMKNTNKNLEIIILLLITIMLFLTNKNILHKSIYTLIAVFSSLYFFPFKLFIYKISDKISLYSSLFVSLILSLSIISIIIETKKIDNLFNILIIINSIFIVFTLLNRQKYNIQKHDIINHLILCFVMIGSLSYN